MAKICSQCHNSAEDTAAFCDICGAKFQPGAGDGGAIGNGAIGDGDGAIGDGGALGAAGACPNCGMQNLPGELYCDTCGMQLPPVMVTPPPPPVEISGAYPPPQGGDPYNPGPANPPAGFTPGFFPGGANVEGGLFIVSGTSTTIVISGNKSELIIGRADYGSSPDIDTNPANGEALGVSRQHARLLIQSGQIAIEDLNSTNFTYVNRQRLQPGQRVPIRAGDEVRLARLVLIYQG